ncbi:unnamed protein product [Rotaria sp. Silwood2]|nr:unnamed protein product [Rotaria sp. Silwood2]
MSYAEASRAAIDAFVASGAKGIVIAGTGDGTIHRSLQQAAIDAVKQGVTIVRSSRIPPSTEDLVDETAVRALSVQVASTQQIHASSNSTNPSAITVSTKLEFKGQLSHQESNIYGLVTLQAPFIRRSSTNNGSSSLSRVPIDLVCVVDQSGSMSGAKMILLKQTLMYITEQLTELDRLAIISFDNHAYDRSHGLKRMNEKK